MSGEAKKMLFTLFATGSHRGALEATLKAQRIEYSVRKEEEKWYFTIPIQDLQEIYDLAIEVMKTHQEGETGEPLVDFYG